MKVRFTITTNKGVLETKFHLDWSASLPRIGDTIAVNPFDDYDENDETILAIVTHVEWSFTSVKEAGIKIFDGVYITAKY